MRRVTQGRDGKGGILAGGLRALVTVGYVVGATVVPVAGAYAVEEVAEEVVECDCKCHEEGHECECEDGKCRCFELGHACECPKCKAAREAAEKVVTTPIPVPVEDATGSGQGGDGGSGTDSSVVEGGGGTLPADGGGSGVETVPSNESLSDESVKSFDVLGDEAGDKKDVPVIDGANDEGRKDGVELVEGKDGGSSDGKPVECPSAVEKPLEADLEPVVDEKSKSDEPGSAEGSDMVPDDGQVVGSGDGVTGIVAMPDELVMDEPASVPFDDEVVGAHLGTDAMSLITPIEVDVVDGERPDDIVVGETPLSDVFGVGSYTPHATGSYVSDPDSVRDRYARRVYSAFHTLGLSDEQIAGMLSNLQSECNIDPTTIEGIYDEPFSVAGGRKALASASRDALSQWTLQLLTTAWPQGYGGTLGSDGHVSGAHVGSEYGVASDFYGPGTDGRFYPGIGIGSWTGQSQVSHVLDGADELKVRWYDIDYQIAAMMAYPGNGSDGLGIYDEYMSACAGKSASECASWFLAHWEGCPGVREASHVATADEWLSRIRSEKWETDVASGARSLSLAARLGVDFGDDAERIEELLEDVTVTSVSSLADALVSYSYSKAPSLSDGYAGTKRYADVWAQVAPGDEYFRSCDRSVACAIRWCGLDDAFPLGSCETQWMHCMSHPETWAYVGDFQASSTGAASEAEALAAGLQPGDILITQSNHHTMAFVGSDTVNRVYAAEVRGTDGDLGEPDEGAAWVSGSIGVDGAASTWSTGPGSGRAPGIGMGGDACAHTYSVFRYAGDPVTCPVVSNSVSSEVETVVKDGAEVAKRASAAVGADYDVCDHSVGDDVSESSFSMSGLVDYALGRDVGSSSIKSLVEEVRLTDGARLSVSDVRPGDVVVTEEGLCVAVGDGHAVGSRSGDGVVDVELSKAGFVGAAPLL